MEQKNRIVSEYYFDYKIEKVFSEDESIQTPKLYFERDYSDLSQYILYTVVEEWRDKDKLERLIKKSNIDPELKQRATADGKGNNKATFWTVISKDGKPISDICKLLPYDSVKIYYDTHGVDAGVFTNAKDEVHKAVAVDGEDYTLDKFWSEGCRLKVLKGDSINYSGVGQIEYRCGNKIVAKFFFAVNYAIRKKINYQLTFSKGGQKDKIKLEFECDNAPVGIRVSLLSANNRLPCLTVDSRASRVGKPIELCFKKSKVKNKYVFEKEELVEHSLEGTMYSLAFDDVDMEKYYVLSCIANNTMPKKISAEERKPVAWKSSCPYCHSLLDSKLAYVKGGVSCQGKQGAEIYEKKKLQLSKNAIYCQGDLTEKNVLASDFKRLLPKDFLSHDNFKVAFTGSMRAGKTTYISRLFNINKNGTNKNVALTLNMIKKPLERFNVAINHAVLPLIGTSDKEVKAKGRVEVIEDNNWDVRSKYYDDRAIDLRVGAFPTGTQTGLAFTKYPFCVEAKKIAGKGGGSSYVSFYDVAGEDAQSSQGTLETIGCKKDAPIGIFVLINGKKDSDSNDMIIDVLQKADINSDSPVAVILTKFDILKENFDGNCHCLRSDYLNYSFDKYDDSYLEREIDISSQEVRSYLSKEIPMTLGLETKFNNIKYFALSSFNYSDSIIHKKDENENDPGELKFESSGFRLELPLVWMLRQFGIID